MVQSQNFVTVALWKYVCKWILKCSNNSVSWFYQISQSSVILSFRFAMTCGLDITANIDPLKYWLNHPHLTYKLRLCDNNEPENNTIVHLRPEKTIQIKWWNTDSITAAHGCWARTSESGIAISSDNLTEKYRPNLNKQHRPYQVWLYFVLLEGTCVYREVGVESSLYLMPYTNSQFAGPRYNREHRTETDDTCEHHGQPWIIMENRVVEQWESNDVELQKEACANDN